MINGNNWGQINRIALEVINTVERAMGVSLKDTLRFHLEKDKINTKSRSLICAVSYRFFHDYCEVDWVLEKSVNIDVNNNANDPTRNILRIGTLELLLFKYVPFQVILGSCLSALPNSNEEDRSFIRSSLTIVNDNIKNNRIALPSREKEPLKYLMVKSYPKWMAEKFIEWYGEEGAVSLGEAMRHVSAGYQIRVNKLKIGVDTLKRKLEREGVSVSEGRYCKDDSLIISLPATVSNPYLLNSYREGDFIVQDESAVLVSILLDPQPNETIIDLCSAPGGKITHMASIMRNHGVIRAVDINHERIRRVSQICEHLGIDIVQTYEFDGRSVSLEELDLNEKVDRVLVDAPCSCLGTIARRPDLCLKIKPEDIIKYKRIQKALLHNASNLLKQGGHIVYSTCTIGPEENDDVVSEFLETHREFEQINLLRTKTKLPNEVIDKLGFLRTLPNIHIGLNGNFAALLKKQRLSNNSETS